jgi:hypothetical protein
LALEIITKQLTRVGVPSLNDPSAPQVLKDLGGYTRVVEDCVERILKRHIDNPRAAALMEHAQRTLRGQVPTLRARVQSMLNRVRLATYSPVARAVWAPKPDGPPLRLPLANGAYPEVEVRAKSIGWKGKVDLLVLSDSACEITDFKTGAADEAHKFQVRAYAAMWRLDSELNPSRRLVDRLVLAYENQDIDVNAPSASDIDDLDNELLSRRQAAEAALTVYPPPARPGFEVCRYCGVRQLCSEYWTGATQSVSDDGRFGDVELKIKGRHGPKSWDAVVVGAHSLPAKTAVLLRLDQPEEFGMGTVLRVVDGALSQDPEDASAVVIVTIGLFSELYVRPSATTLGAGARTTD